MRMNICGFSPKQISVSGAVKKSMVIRPLYDYARDLHEQSINTAALV